MTFSGWYEHIASIIGFKSSSKLAVTVVYVSKIAIITSNLKGE
jgi:hypothetical protein